VLTLSTLYSLLLFFLLPCGFLASNDSSETKTSGAFDSREPAAIYPAPCAREALRTPVVAASGGGG
jgi:hypothetical protein